MGSQADCSSAAASSSPKPSSSSSSGSTTREPPLTSSGENTEAEAESRLQEELDTPEPPSECCDDPDFEALESSMARNPDMWANLSAEGQRARVEEGFFEENDEESGSDSESDSSSLDNWGADSNASTCFPGEDDDDDDDDDDDHGGSQAAVGALPQQAAPTWLDEEVGDIDYPAAPEEEEDIDGGNDLQAESDIDVWEEADSDDEFDMQAAIERWNAWQRRRAQRRSRDA